MEFEFRADREAHLRLLCTEMGRSVDDFVNEAVLTFMEDYEDGREAREAMGEISNGNKTISLEELMKRYDLGPADLTEGAEADRSVGQADAASGDRLSPRATDQAA